MQEVNNKMIDDGATEATGATKATEATEATGATETNGSNETTGTNGSIGRIAAVVVTYNRKALLLECIAALKAQTVRPDILIIDNASTDGTEESLAPLAAEGIIRYQNTGANLGGAGGFSYGMKMAVEEGWDYVWIMDDDTIPRENALEMLLKAHQQLSPYGYLSSKTLWKDGTLCNMNLQRDPDMKMIRSYTKEIIPSGTATFVSLFVPSSVIRDVGLPIAEFFIWADDLEYTRRIARKYPCFVVTNSVAVHKCPTNNGGNIATDEESRIGRYRFAYRNEVYVYRREGWKGICHLLLRTPLHIVRVIRYAKSRKGERIRVILGSTLKGIGFHPEIRFPD